MKLLIGTTHTDHKPLTYINNTGTETKFMELVVEINEFDAKVEYIQGCENHFPDLISRLEIECNAVTGGKNQNIKAKKEEKVLKCPEELVTVKAFKEAISKYSKVDIAKAQEKDKELFLILQKGTHRNMKVLKDQDSNLIRITVFSCT